LPTLGRPTMPTSNAMRRLYRWLALAARLPRGLTLH